MSDHSSDSTVEVKKESSVVEDSDNVQDPSVNDELVKLRDKYEAKLKVARQMLVEKVIRIQQLEANCSEDYSTDDILEKEKEEDMKTTRDLLQGILNQHSSTSDTEEDTPSSELSLSALANRVVDLMDKQQKDHSLQVNKEKETAHHLTALHTRLARDAQQAHQQQVKAQHEVQVFSERITEQAKQLQLVTQEREAFRERLEEAQMNAQRSEQCSIDLAEKMQLAVEMCEEGERRASRLAKQLEEMQKEEEQHGMEHPLPILLETPSQDQTSSSISSEDERVTERNSELIQLASMEKERDAMQASMFELRRKLAEAQNQEKTESNMDDVWIDRRVASSLLLHYLETINTKQTNEALHTLRVLSNVLHWEAEECRRGGLSVPSKESQTGGWMARLVNEAATRPLAEVWMEYLDHSAHQSQNDPS